MEMYVLALIGVPSGLENIQEYLIPVRAGLSNTCHIYRWGIDHRAFILADPTSCTGGQFDDRSLCRFDRSIRLFDVGSDEFYGLW